MAAIGWRCEPAAQCRPPKPTMRQIAQSAIRLSSAIGPKIARNRSARAGLILTAISRHGSQTARTQARARRNRCTIERGRIIVSNVSQRIVPINAALTTAMPKCAISLTEPLQSMPTSARGRLKRLFRGALDQAATAPSRQLAGGSRQSHAPDAERRERPRRTGGLTVDDRIDRLPRAAGRRREREPGPQEVVARRPAECQPHTAAGVASSSAVDWLTVEPLAYGP